MYWEFYKALYRAGIGGKWDLKDVVGRTKEQSVVEEKM
jgi:hypothetical protein